VKDAKRPVAREKIERGASGQAASRKPEKAPKRKKKTSRGK
jgi:hypothetical protein